MRISCQSFSLPKAGRSFVDCEDAYFPGDLHSQQLYEINHDQTDVFRASVSDGATDSIFSKLWAQLLAFGYGAGKWASDITAESIMEEQGAWLDFLGKQQLPWYAEEKAELGAFAAMVGLTLFDDTKQWTAMALGDCCIFHIRNGECVRSFPISESAAFSNFPLLLCSVADRNSNVFDSKQVILDGTWQTGDQFVLMSDTVACWFISQIENGNARATISNLESAHSLDAFVSLINHARTTKGGDGNVLMRDDDVTVTLVKVADHASPPLPKKFDSQALAAAVRPTVEISKIAVNETKNTAELPPIPVQNKTVTPPLPPPPSSHINRDATEGSGGMVREDPSLKPSYVSRSGAKSNQPGMTIFIVGAIAVAAAAIAATTLFSQKGEKHPNKVKSPPVSETAPSTTKSDDITATQSVKHHRSKHKLKKTHPVAMAPTASSSSGQTPDTAPETASPRSPAPKPADRPKILTHDRMPPQAPDRIRLPFPAPDRTSGVPVQLPDQVPQERGLDHSSIGHNQHRGKPVSQD
ncbi:hypothetical protein BH10CYA1_BH10CYA1_09080 [soil metagenome]